MRNALTRLLLYLLLKVNPHKDRRLSWKLHAIADDYDPRPTGAWR